MRNIILYAIVFLAAGCGGGLPPDGPGAGWVEVDGRASAIVDCSTHEYLDAEGAVDGRAVSVVSLNMALDVSASQRTGLQMNTDVGPCVDVEGDAFDARGLCGGMEVVVHVDSCSRR